MNLGIIFLTFSKKVFWKSIYQIPCHICVCQDTGVRICKNDRLFIAYGKDIAGKECARITCCEEEDMSAMDGARIPMERMCTLNKWKMVVEVLIPGVLNAGDIDKTDDYKKAAALADAI